MLTFLFFCAIILLSIELSYVGKVMGFFQKEFEIIDIVKLVSASLFIVVFIIIGSILGNTSVKVLSDNSLWYAATVLFILGIKLFYDGIKLHKVKQLINPLDFKGLVILSILVGLNSFFVGLSFGLMQISILLIYLSFIVLVAGVILGYFVGLKSKNLNPSRYEFFLGIIYIIIAVVLLIKQ